MTQLWWNSNSTCRATYWMHIPSFKLISQSMLEKSPENSDGRTDGHCHSIIRPFFKRAYKKGTRSRMLIEKENSSHKQLMSNLICCNSCRKVGSHIVYVLLSKNLIISFWRKHAYTATEIRMGQASTNFHSLPLTCLTIYLIMLNVPVNYLNCFITALLTQIFILSLLVI